MSHERTILRMLARGPLCGIDIVQHPDADIPCSSVYVTLDRLRARKLVTSEMVAAPRGRPRRRYSITDKGRDSLRVCRECGREVLA